MQAQTITAPALLNCGHVPTPDAGIGTGYGTDALGYTMCYACASENDRARIRFARPGDSIMLYVTGATDRGARVINWPGDRMMKLIYIDSPSKWHPKRYVRALDDDGREWYGVGPRESGTYVTFRPVTGRPYLPTSRVFVR